MLRRFVLTAVAGVLLLGASCQSFTWDPRSSDTDAEAHARGVKDVKALEHEYEAQRYWSFWRKNVDGVADSFHAGLHRIHEGIDRHLLNHSWTYPPLGY